MSNSSTLKSVWKKLTTESCPDEDDILNYFIYSKHPVSGKSKKCKRQLKKARGLCDEHFWGSMKVNHVSDTYSVIAAECRPSMRHLVKIDGKIYYHYSLRVIIIKTGQIENSSYYCKAGKAGLCANVRAALFAVIKIKKIHVLPVIVSEKNQRKFRDLQVQKDYKTLSSSHQIIPPPMKPYPDAYMSGRCKNPEVFFLKTYRKD